MELNRKREIARNIHWLFTEKGGTILKLKVESEEDSRFIRGEVSLPTDPFIEPRGHPVNVTDAFTERIKDLVKLACDKPVELRWNNTQTSFWFDPDGA